MQGDCLVNILRTSFIKPAAKRSLSLSPPSPFLCLFPSLFLSCTRISSRGRAGKGYSNSTLRYNQDHWSNSLLSIYTHIQFVRTLRGVSGEVFVWLDLSGSGPHGFSLMWVQVCVHKSNTYQDVFPACLYAEYSPHTLAFSHHHQTALRGRQSNPRKTAPESFTAKSNTRSRWEVSLKYASNIESVVNLLIVPHIKALSLRASLPACWSTNKVTSPPSEKYIGHLLSLLMKPEQTGQAAVTVHQRLPVAQNQKRAARHSQISHF